MHGHDLEADHRAGLAANQLHHVVQGHVDDVHQLAGLAFADGDDLVLKLQMAFFLGRPAGYDLLHHRIAVAGLERCPDAFQVQLHHDLEVFQRAGRHVIGVRIERLRHRGQIHLEQLFILHLVHALARL